MIEVKVLEGLVGRETGGPDAGLAAVGGSGGDLSVQAGGQKLLVAPILLPGPRGQTLHPAEQGGRLQLAAQPRQVLGGRHATTPSARS